MLDATTETVIVFAGGDAVGARHVARLAPDAAVIAADSGLDHAHRLGWSPDLVIGDLDSVSAPGLERAAREGTTIDRHPPDKDQTDLELALDRAASWSPRHLVLVGGHGGRLDHFMGNLLALARPSLRGIETDAVLGDATLHVIHERRSFTGRSGELLTLLPVGGPAVDVRTRGLRFPLEGETLDPGTGRGVSNELVDTDASVSLRSGTLLAIRPDVAIYAEPTNREESP